MHSDQVTLMFFFQHVHFCLFCLRPKAFYNDSNNIKMKTDTWCLYKMYNKIIALPSTCLHYVLAFSFFLYIYIYIYCFIADNISISMYIMCVIII